MRQKKVIYMLVISIITLAACATPTSEPPTDQQAPEPAHISPTSAPEPTVEPSPEPTPTIEASATPENLIFRDDFTGELQPGWTWENENPDLWKITDDGWLQIIGEDMSLLSDEYQSNMLWRELPSGDFIISIHLRAQPIANFQQATLYIYEDPDNYVALNRGYCDICIDNGSAFYMEYKIYGGFGSYNKPTDETDVYIRLAREADVITGYYAFEPEQWERIGRYGGSYFEFKRVGIGVSNVDPFGADADLVGLFDYFEITRP